jgi:hypothetical protein
MFCLKCKQPIPQERLEILPNTKTCKDCSEVQKPIGFMIYSHKTAPTIHLINPSNIEELRLAKRANKRAR